MTDLMTFEPRRILVCQLRQIGDVLLTTPSIRLLRQRYPKAILDVFTEKKCLPVLEHNPHINTVWTVDKKLLPTLAQEIAFYRQVARQADLVVDFQQLPRCRCVTFLSRAKVRLSYFPPWYNRFLYTHWTTLSGGYSAKHRASLLAPLGITWNGEAPEIFLRAEETAWAQDFLDAHGLQAGAFITVDPTHRRLTRQWPARHYGTMLAQVHAARPDLRFLLLFGPGERDAAAQVLEYCPTPQAVVLPREMIGLRQMAALQSLARLHVGNCSGPRHFAVAVGCPSLTILGATSGAWRFPSSRHHDIFMDLPCRPCNRNSCVRKDLACLEGLAPELVSQRVLELIEPI